MSPGVQPWMQRTELLLGTERLEKLIQHHVLLVGLGGVGAFCAEMLCRAGIQKLTLVDADDIESSNRNRQLAALVSTEGKLKAEVLSRRLLDINPEVRLTVVPQYIHKHNVQHLLFDKHDYNFVVDAIDTLQPKVALIESALDARIPLVSSMGAGGRVDPSLIRTADMEQSFGCNLARDVRKHLHKKGIYGGFEVVFSPEVVDKNRLVLVNDGRKKSVIGTISYMPALFGCMLASLVLRRLMKEA